MDLDTLIKYLIWIAFFAIALTALYFVLKKIGVL